MELRFSYKIRAVKPPLHSCCGTNEFGDKQLMVVELFKMEQFLRLQEEKEEVLGKGIRRDNCICVTASDIKTVTRSETRVVWCSLHRLLKNSLPRLREVKLCAVSILAHLLGQLWQTNYVRLPSCPGPPRFLPAALASPA